MGLFTAVTQVDLTNPKVFEFAKEVGLTPLALMDKIKASISKIGKAKGFQYVVNVADLLLADGPDLTADVKKDLGF